MAYCKNILIYYNNLSVAVYVPVVGGQNLILAAAVQSLGRAIFNIQSTMVECRDLHHTLHSQYSVIY